LEILAGHVSAFAREGDMKQKSLTYPRPLLRRVLGLAFVYLLGGLLQPALAQKKNVVDPSQNVDWAAGAIGHAQKMRNSFTRRDFDQSSQTAPGNIPSLEIHSDASGRVATFQPGGATDTGQNAFFQNLGTNGRTCFSCHQPQDAWTISAASARARFEASGGTDPLFRLIDGATCPTDDISTPAAKQQAYKLLIEKGLIRVGIPLPANSQFEVHVDNDPYGCTTNTVTGLQSPTLGVVSLYRRPLPSTNLGFLTAIMWDGREPSFESQSVHATRIHAEATNDPSVEQQAEIVAFESGIFTAQIFDNKAHELHAARATGGPGALSQQKFFVGINDPFVDQGSNFSPNIFDLYKPWLDLPAARGEAQDRKSVARGEEVFNTTKINITGVAGLPDMAGFCGTCHDSPNVGNHSVKAPLNIGIADAGNNNGLDVSDLPVFTLKCDDGQTFVVTDPGRALITGNCADIGKFKGPILRGLAARAPYFHNGSAATLMDVVNFYNQRFGIGLTAQQKDDLVNFLKTL
jgi:cytochrome c peroxidase